MSQASASLSARWGIPAAIPINDHKRYSYCDAMEATLEDVSPDGRFATYKGTCVCKHVYLEKLEVEELKRKTRVVIKGDGYAYEYDDKTAAPTNNKLGDY